jgi:hypothetical protein
VPSSQHVHSAIQPSSLLPSSHPAIQPSSNQGIKSLAIKSLAPLPSSPAIPNLSPLIASPKVSYHFFSNSPINLLVFDFTPLAVYRFFL